MARTSPTITSMEGWASPMISCIPSASSRWSLASSRATTQLCLPMGRRDPAKPSPWAASSRPECNAPGSSRRLWRRYSAGCLRSWTRSSQSVCHSSRFTRQARRCSIRLETLGRISVRYGERTCTSAGHGCCCCCGPCRYGVLSTLACIQPGDLCVSYAATSTTHAYAGQHACTQASGHTCCC